MYFSQRIKKFRTNQGMTQEQFGKLFGVSKAVVNNWEHMRNYPNKNNLKKIADYMGLTPTELACNYFDYEVWANYGKGQTKKLYAVFRRKREAELYIEFLKERNLPRIGKLEIKEI